MHSPENTGLESRLDAVQQQLAQVQELLVNFSQKLDQQRIDTSKVTEGIQSWVTDYVSLRLQELVPHTCEHDDEPGAADGPVPAWYFGSVYGRRGAPGWPHTHSLCSTDGGAESSRTGSPRGNAKGGCGFL